VLAAVGFAIVIVALAGYLSLSTGPSSHNSVFFSTTTQPSSLSLSSASTTNVTPTQNATSTACGASVTQSDWTTYHGSNSRVGYSSSEVSCAKEDWQFGGLDGDVYAEPLVYHGLVVVATENDSVYALNATTGRQVWVTHVGTPMDGSALPCGDINPSGITGTPVIDPSTGSIYVVAFEAPGAHYLVALGEADGQIQFTKLADPSGADPLVEQERGALSLAGGRVYVPFGGLEGDCGDYHGWVVGINAVGSGGQVSYQVPTGREGGIWAPSGIAIDESGHLFVATGNGASTSTFDHGDSVIELSPTLTELGYFAPSNWSELNSGDNDLGSVGPMLLGQREVFQIGKEGVGYLLNATVLGGVGGQIFEGQVCSSAFGGDASVGDMVFVPCTDGLHALSVKAGSFQAAWMSADFPSGPPIVTGNVVWALDTSNGTLHGYAANSGVGLYSFNTGPVTRFTTPSAGDGRVFVAAGTSVFAFSTG